MLAAAKATGANRCCSSTRDASSARYPKGVIRSPNTARSATGSSASAGSPAETAQVTAARRLSTSIIIRSRHTASSGPRKPAPAACANRA